MNVRELSAVPLIAEYQSVVSESTSKEDGEIDWARLHSELVRTADWTDAGATHVARLARDYGSFILRNALALAVAAGIGDGELGL